jgi:hypothetical protein
VPESYLFHLLGLALSNGLPPGWIGRPVKVQWDELHVRILHPGTSQLLREHLRQKRGGYRIQEEDHPKKTRTTTLGQPPKRRHAFSCSWAQMRELERHVSKRTDLRL